MNGLYEKGRKKALDFDPFLCHETKNVFCKTKQDFVLFFAVYETINIHLELPKRCIHEHIFPEHNAS